MATHEIALERTSSFMFLQRYCIKNLSVVESLSMSSQVETSYQHTTNTNAASNFSILSSPEDIVKPVRASLAYLGMWEGPVTVHLHQLPRNPPSGSNKFWRVDRPLLTLVRREASALEKPRDLFHDIHYRIQQRDHLLEGCRGSTTTGSKSRAIQA